MIDDVEEAGDPNCPDCLVRMEVSGSVDRPYWRCPSCGMVAVS